MNIYTTLTGRSSVGINVISPPGLAVNQMGVSRKVHRASYL
jgi:hypothetical protein